MKTQQLKSLDDGEKESESEAKNNLNTGNNGNSEDSINVDTLYKQGYGKYKENARASGSGVQSEERWKKISSND